MESSKMDEVYTECNIDLEDEFNIDLEVDSSIKCHKLWGNIC